ncbi:glycosyltransferase [Leucobacter sp. 7(1)]|uniref:glycosyltransferase n=1 Tax=Leucobacter sp. 7(1) TaxID=1255613 RepID=UPI0034E9412B
MARRVTVWRLDSLPGSETFIRNQLDAMVRWEPTLLGSLRVCSPLSREEDPVVFTRSLWDRVALFWASVTGRSSQIREALRQTRPDLVHAHFAKDAWMILRACRALQIPLVVTVHGYDVTALPRVRGVRGCINRCRTRRVLRSADAVVAVSEFIRDEALRWGAPQRGVRVLPIGVPVTESAVAVSRPVDVVFLGRLVPKKGVSDALQAIAAQPDAQALTCEVIGDGPLRADVEALAKQLDLQVTFTGSLSPARVAQHLARARVLIAPSRYAADGDAEGFGMVFLEAALAGVPAVAYRHGGVPEAVVDGETGLLVREGDIAALASSLRELLADEDLRVAMGEAARQRVREQFDVAVRTPLLERLFDEVTAVAIARDPGARSQRPSTQNEGES